MKEQKVIVCLLGWLGSSPKHFSKYSQSYLSLNSQFKPSSTSPLPSSSFPTSNISQKTSQIPYPTSHINQTKKIDFHYIAVPKIPSFFTMLSRSRAKPEANEIIKNIQVIILLKNH